MAPRRRPRAGIELVSKKTGTEQPLELFGIEHQLQLSLIRWGRTRRRFQLLQVQAAGISVVFAVRQLRSVTFNSRRLDQPKPGKPGTFETGVETPMPRRRCCSSIRPMHPPSRRTSRSSRRSASPQQIDNMNPEPKKGRLLLRPRFIDRRSLDGDRVPVSWSSTAFKRTLAQVFSQIQPRRVTCATS